MVCLSLLPHMRRTIMEVTLIQLTFDFYMIEAKPEKLIGDKAYDSDPLDEELANEGIEMIAPLYELSIFLVISALKGFPSVRPLVCLSRGPPYE
jgi:hypothetical protein